MSPLLKTAGHIRLPSLGRWVQTLLLAGALTVTVAACNGVTLSEVQGIVQNVDSISGVATIHLKDGSTMTVDLSQVNLQAVGTVIGSVSLAPGDQVSLNVDSQGEAHEIETHRSEVKGTLTAVDLAAGTITIEHEGTTQTLTVSPGVKVEVGDNEQASLVDLTLGAQLDVRVDTTSGLVVKIENDDEENGHEGEGQEGVTPVKGTGDITAIDAAAHTISVTAPDGTVSALTVTASTKLDLEGPDTFAGLKVGMKVEAKVDPLTGALLKVQEREAGDGEHENEEHGDSRQDGGAQGDEEHASSTQGDAEQRDLEGTISALDTAAQTVTITDENGSATTYTATDATRIEVTGSDTFSGLKVGLKVEAKVDPLTGALLKVQEREAGDGEHENEEHG